MSTIYNFPGGYEVKIYKKEDILKSINDNIIDKDIAYEIIEQCEKNAAEYIKKGRWAGIPFIGNIRIPKTLLAKETDEYKDAIEDAKLTCDNYQFVAFRKQLNFKNYLAEKHHKYFLYVVSMQINKNKVLYKRLCKKFGVDKELIVYFIMYTIRNLNICESHEE